MFRIYKKKKNFVKWVSFVLISLVILSFLNFNNHPYANVNERPDQTNINGKKKLPRASLTYVTTDQTNEIYNDNIVVDGSTVTFKNCTWLDSYQLYIISTSDVTIENCSLCALLVEDTSQVYMVNSTARDDAIFRDDSNISMENCTLYDSVYIRESSIVVIENCTFSGPVVINYYYDSYRDTNVYVNNSRFEYSLSVTNSSSGTIIQNSVFNAISIFHIDCSINETLELWSHSDEAQFSNFKAFESGGSSARISVYKNARLNVSNINREALKLDVNASPLEGFPFDLSSWGSCSVHAKNSDLYYVFIDDTFADNGKSIATFQNCSIYGSPNPFSEVLIRSNYTVFSNCTFYDIIECDTKYYDPNIHMYHSGNPFKIENCSFFSYINVISGSVEIDKCNFETVLGFLWLKGPDTLALINNSDPIYIKQELNSELIAENFACETISMQDSAKGFFNNMDIGIINVLGLANATIDNCHINSANFESPNVQITNSIVDIMAPTLDAIPSPLNDLTNFILNWSTQPGKNLTGNIVSYEVFRAEMGIGGATPSPTDFTSIYTDSTYPFDTEYNDTAIANYDGYEIYYTVEITDQGDNSGNSTILSTVYDTGLVFEGLEATVIFDDSLTTYDDINVTVFMIDADINNNGTQDVGNASLHCQFKYGSTIVNQVIDPTVESIDGIVYYFLIPQTLAATEIKFSIQIEQNSYFDGFGSFDFNSTSPTKYGKKFTIERPTIAFNPVDHPSGDKILVSKRIKLSVSAVSDAQYISSLKVYYRVDGGDWESKSMSYDSEDSEYTVKLPEFDPCTLEYYVKYIDIAGNEHDLLGSKDDPETIEVIPDFPRTRLETFDLAIIFIGSALVGIVFGFAYVFLDLSLKKRTTLSRTQKLKSFLDYPDKSKRAPAKKTPAKKTPAKSASAKKKVEGK